MIRKKQLILSLCLLFWLLSIGVFGAIPVSAQNPPSLSKAEQARTLIVKIRAKNSFGAGILFSLRGGYLFIATANHVIQGSPKELEELFVEFEFLRGVMVQAEFVHAYPKLDLAVLRVDIENSRLRDAAVAALPFDLLGKTLTLQRGDEVYPIGHPEGEDWDVPATPGVIKKVVAEEISFEPSCLAGHSGGGLFDANWTLVGMMTHTLGRSCEAISFERICATLEDDWGLVVNHEPLPLGPANAVPIPITPTAPPAPSIAEQQQQKLQDLLAQAQSYFKMQWFTTPAETNAFDVYCQVLQLDPDNPQALQSIQQMLAFYKTRAKQAEQQGNSPKAIQYYQGYLKIAPNDDEVLDKLFQLQAPTPRPLPTSTPTQRPTARPAATPAPVPKKTPKVTLRSTSRTVSEDEALDVFGLMMIREFDWGKGFFSQTYIDNQYEDQDDVVMDHATGLMWQKSGSDKSLTYDKAQVYVQELNRQKFAGYADWRLPTVPELLSLLEPQKQSNDLYIHPLFDSRQRWCRSADKRSAESAWYVNFDDGFVSWHDMYNEGYVRAVRSSILTSPPTVLPTVTPTLVPQQTPRFILRSTPIIVSEDAFLKEFDLNENWRPRRYVDNDFEVQSEVVIDHVTGLMWQQSGSENYLTYDKAHAYIQELNRRKFAGYADWRLPTIPELLSLLEPQKSSKGLYIDPIFDSTQSWCWSADLRQIKGESSAESAWNVSFNGGFVSWYYLNHSSYVRAVRSMP